jgi:uncharacterized membrane protein (UPF0127 family)
MMAVLKNKQNQILLSDLEIASDLFSRAKGLLGKKQISNQQGLWIHDCNSIHTFLMNFSIDCIFLDSKLKVKSLKSNIKPGRLVWPQWGAKSVIEVSAGQIQSMNIQIGDELHVGN